MHHEILADIEHVLNFGYAESVDKGVRREDSQSIVPLSAILKQFARRIYPLRGIICGIVRILD